ncbi:MAG: cyclic nucleotide-binding domain-containing protein [Bacteroidales bacterium]|nr:cyclic nucleotide-binding domain-containing protein [Bacteroidales bacterium]
MDRIPELQILDTKVQFLKDVTIFQGTAHEHLMEIAVVLEEVEYGKEQPVFKKGDPGDALFIITQGKVRIHDGTHVLTRLEKGQVFGEYSLFDQENRSATVTAEESTILYRLNQHDFYDLLENNVDVLQGVLKSLIGQIRHMNELESKLAKSYLKIHKQKQEIEKQHQEILIKKQQLESGNDALARINEEKNELLRILAHDLRNPITSSTCLVEVLNEQKSELNKDHRECVEVLQNSLYKMNTMISHILDINEIESRGISVHMERLNIALVLKEVSNNYSYALNQKEIDLQMAQSNQFVNADRNYAYLVFDNLLHNAIKYSPKEKEIHINIVDLGDSIRIGIKDQGAGIKEEDQKKLYGYYQRVKENEEGQMPHSLSIIRKYVKAMNGAIWIDSKRGKGATIYVELQKRAE